MGETVINTEFRRKIILQNVHLGGPEGDGRIK